MKMINDLHRSLCNENGLIPAGETYIMLFSTIAVACLLCVVLNRFDITLSTAGLIIILIVSGVITSTVACAIFSVKEKKDAEKDK